MLAGQTHHLSLIEGTKVRIIDDSAYKTRLTAIENAGSEGHFYDSFGSVHSFQVLHADEQEKRYLISAISGESFLVGESHTIFCRDAQSARYKRTPVSELTGPAFVRLPQKKLEADPTLFDQVDLDGDGLFIESDSIQKLTDYAAKVATCGITVSRHKTKRLIRLENGRPSCFATKLLNGNFDQHFEVTMESLCRSGIIIPYQFYGDSFLLETQKSGVIFEGNSIFNEVPCIVPRKLETKGRVIHIRLTTPNVPVEMTWFQT